MSHEEPKEINKQGEVRERLKHGSPTEGNQREVPEIAVKLCV